MTRALLVAALVWLGLQVSILVLMAVEPALARNVVALGVAHALVLGGAVLLASERQDRRAIAAGFNLRSIGFGLLLGVCLKLPADGVRSLVEHLNPTDPDQLQQQLEFLRHDTWWQTFLLFAVIGGSGPLMEEAFYRGFIFRALRRVGSRNHAIGVTTLLFVVAHPSMSDWPSLLLVGLVLGIVRAADGNIWSAVGAHVAFNSATVLAVVLGLQGGDVDGEFPIAAATLSAGLVLGLLTLRLRRT